MQIKDDLRNDIFREYHGATQLQAAGPGLHQSGVALQQEDLA